MPGSAGSAMETAAEGPTKSQQKKSRRASLNHNLHRNMNQKTPPEPEAQQPCPFGVITPAWVGNVVFFFSLCVYLKQRLKSQTV